VFERCEPFARLRFLIWELSVGRCEELFVEVYGLSALMQCIIRRCPEEEGRRRRWLNCSTESQRLQCNSWVVYLGGGEGEVSGGVAERGGRGEGGGIGDGLLEQGLGLAGAVESDEGFGAGVEQGRVGVFPFWDWAEISAA